MREGYLTAHARHVRNVASPTQSDVNIKTDNYYSSKYFKVSFESIYGTIQCST